MQNTNIRYMSIAEKDYLLQQTLKINNTLIGITFTQSVIMEKFKKRSLTMRIPSTKFSITKMRSMISTVRTDSSLRTLLSLKIVIDAFF